MLLWRVASSALPYLDSRAEAVALQFSAALAGRAGRPPRWRHCVQEVAGGLPPLVGSLYVQRFFRGSAQAAAQEMVDRIRAEFTSLLTSLQWMEPDTRARAVSKARAMREFIGAPVELSQVDFLCSAVNSTNVVFSLRSWPGCWRGSSSARRITWATD